MNSTPLHIHLSWWQAWRKQVRAAKADPKNEGYQRAALLAQGEYVMYQAQYFGEVKP